MSRPYAKLPAWIDHGVIPLLNVVVAFLVAGLVVLAVYWLVLWWVYAKRIFVRL